MRSRVAGLRVSTGGTGPLPAAALASRTLADLGSAPETLLVTGTSPLHLAAFTCSALARGYRLVLLPGRPRPPLPDGLQINIDADGAVVRRRAGRPLAESRWQVAMFTSGSTDRPRGFGFTTEQLRTVTRWYEHTYQVTGDSAIVTSLPVTYNFTFVAGVLLAAELGARLHLSAGPEQVLPDAGRLAAGADRVIVLANPVLLDYAAAFDGQVPGQVLVDSGGAPLSVAAIAAFRDSGIDVREGYGLTETASLTHFDSTPSMASLGTVGTPMPGADAAIDSSTGKPVIEITSPAIGIPLDPRIPPPRGPLLRTTDLGHIDGAGRLRLLGRTDDVPINRWWPRDTLDVIGPLIGRRCALIRHPAPDRVVIRLAAALPPEDLAAIRQRAAEFLDLPADAVAVEGHRGGLLHSLKIPRNAKGTT